MKVHQIQKKLESLQSQLQLIHPSISKLISVERSVRQQEMAAGDYASWNLTVAYALESLIYIYARLEDPQSLKPPSEDSTDPAELPVLRDIERIQSYYQKVKRRRPDSGNEEARKRSRLDSAAAGRFVRHALGNQDNQNESSPISEESHSNPPIATSAEEFLKDTLNPGDE